MVKMSDAQKRLERAREELRIAEQEARREIDAAMEAPEKILALCAELRAIPSVPKVRTLIDLVEPLAARLKDALDNRCRGQCGGFSCDHDAALERLIGGRRS